MISHGFGPVIDAHSDILILGSFPSAQSREAGFFYMHPQNRFWQVISALCDDDFVHADIALKKRLLERHRIALYDVVERCEIKGSADASIRQVMPADIPTLIQGSEIKRIGLNGRKAYDLFQKHHGCLMHMAMLLPSTSSANARYTLEELVTQWQTRLLKP